MTTRFNPADYTAPKPKPLPVILLLDTSGSMYGDKISALNVAVRKMPQLAQDKILAGNQRWILPQISQ